MDAETVDLAQLSRIKEQGDQVLEEYRVLKAVVPGHQVKTRVMICATLATEPVESPFEQKLAELQGLKVRLVSNGANGFSVFELLSTIRSERNLLMKPNPEAKE